MVVGQKQTLNPETGRHLPRAALLAAPTFVCFMFGGRAPVVALLNAAIHSDKMQQPVSHPYSYFPKMFPPKLNFVPTVTR